MQLVNKMHKKSTRCGSLKTSSQYLHKKYNISKDFSLSDMNSPFFPSAIHFSRIHTRQGQEKLFLFDSNSEYKNKKLSNICSIEGSMKNT